ncbi:MAG TPA: permease prefix domain 1-containing protein [Streptosporangiaceae bacterium]|nr:permease prefix domain 1-containing protein [Streptosporangiaceae bacterium]
MSPVTDPIEDYLDQLYAKLHTTPRQGRRILAEAEDHLREATAAGIAAGLTEPEAQRAAIASFGSVRAVARAHTRRLPPPAVFGALAMAAWQLVSIAVLAVGASGAVALLLDQIIDLLRLTGPRDTIGLDLNVCQDWTSAVHVPVCAQDALWTSSSATGQRLLALIPGLVLLMGYLLARRHQRNRGCRSDLLPDAFVPTMATCLFGMFTIGLTALAALVPPAATGSLGSGNFLSAAIATLLITIGSLPALRQALLRHAYD